MQKPNISSYSTNSTSSSFSSVSSTNSGTREKKVSLLSLPSVVVSGIFNSLDLGDHARINATSHNFSTAIRFRPTESSTRNGESTNSLLSLQTVAPLKLCSPQSNAPLILKDLESISAFVRGIKPELESLNYELEPESGSNLNFSPKIWKRTLGQVFSDLARGCIVGDEISLEKIQWFFKEAACSSLNEVILNSLLIDFMNELIQAAPLLEENPPLQEKMNRLNQNIQFLIQIESHTVKNFYKYITSTYEDSDELHTLPLVIMAAVLSNENYVDIEPDTLDKYMYHFMSKFFLGLTSLSAQKAISIIFSGSSLLQDNFFKNLKAVLKLLKEAEPETETAKQNERITQIIQILPPSSKSLSLRDFTRG